MTNQPPKPPERIRVIFDTKGRCYVSERSATQWDSNYSKDAPHAEHWYVLEDAPKVEAITKDEANQERRKELDKELEQEHRRNLFERVAVALLPYARVGESEAIHVFDSLEALRVTKEILEAADKFAKGEG